MAEGRALKIDLESLISDWGRDRFLERASNKEKKLLDDKLINLEIDWKRVKFVHEDAVYEPEPPAPGHGRPTQNTLFNTTFTNRTDKEQIYSFRTERTTRSSCSVAVEQGCTTGVEASVKLTTPCQILEANVGFRREMDIHNMESETIEEEMTWGVDSQITVKAGHVGEAKLVILEEEYKGSFSTKTRISGIVRVVAMNLKDNNSFIRASEHSVVEIVKKAFNSPSKLYQPSDALKIDGGQVVSITRGKCRFKYGFKQMIEVDQKPINDKP